MAQTSKLSSDEQADHARSVADYPHLDLAEDEYIVIDVARSRIGLVYIWLVTLLLVALFVVSAMFFANSFASAESKLLIAALGYLLVGMTLIGGLVASAIFRNNYLVVSNQRIFAQVQNAPFARREQSIEIEHIEDTSYVQSGILPHVFNYGTIRLSTVGDEHTYALNYVSDPDHQMRTIVRVVKAVDEGEATTYKKS